MVIPEELDTQLIRPDSGLFGEQVIAFSTTMGLGSMANRTKKGNYRVNQKIKNLLQLLELEKHRIVIMKPNHGNSCLEINQETLSANPNKRYFFIETDALITKERGLILALASADCLPVIFFEPSKKIIGLVHASRKTLEANIFAAVLCRLKEMGGNIENVRFYFGPHIQSCCYRFSPKLAKRYFSDISGSFYFITRHAGQFIVHLSDWAIWQIKQNCAKMTRLHCSISILCSCCGQNPNREYLFFSHRRSHLLKKKEGRNLSCIMHQ